MLLPDRSRNSSDVEVSLMPRRKPNAAHDPSSPPSPSFFGGTGGLPSGKSDLANDLDVLVIVHGSYPGLVGPAAWHRDIAKAVRRQRL